MANSFCMLKYLCLVISLIKHCIELYFLITLKEVKLVDTKKSHNSIMLSRILP